MAECPLYHSQYIYQASAYGFSGEIQRPTRQVIPTQASTVLAAHGGRGSDRVENFKLDRIVSFSAAFVEVGGSYDPCHDRHTSFASSIIENLNILDVVTADRVVSRMAIYSSKETEPDGEHTFNITGSHFEGLKVAGHRIDVKLATQVFHDHDCHSKVTEAHREKKLDSWLLGKGLGKLTAQKVGQLEEEYHALKGMSQVLKRWETPGEKRSTEHITFSAANHLNLEEHTGGPTELLGFGGIICVPKFGVVRLAELTVQKHSRNLVMLRVEMCSTGTGGTSSGGSGGGGVRPPTGP